MKARASWTEGANVARQHAPMRKTGDEQATASGEHSRPMRQSLVIVPQTNLASVRSVPVAQF
jgi:hypothetical protein